MTRRTKGLLAAAMAVVAGSVAVEVGYADRVARNADLALSLARRMHAGASVAEVRASLDRAGVRYVADPPEDGYAALMVAETGSSLYFRRNREIAFVFLSEGGLFSVRIQWIQGIDEGPVEEVPLLPAVPSSSVPAGSSPRPNGSRPAAREWTR